MSEATRHLRWRKVEVEGVEHNVQRADRTESHCDGGVVWVSGSKVSKPHASKA